MTGSVIWAKNVLATISRLRSFHFIVVSSGPPGLRSTNLQAISDLGLNQIFIPFNERSVSSRRRSPEGGNSAVSCLLSQLAEKYHFQGERESRAQRQVDGAFADIVSKEQPDLVAITGVSAAFYVQSVFDQDVPCCLLTTDSAIPMFEYLRSQGGRAFMGGLELWFYRHFNWIANYRMRRHVNGIYRKCVGMVTLTGSDLPQCLRSDVIRAVIPPVLPPRNIGWVYSRTRRLLFVGNIFPGTGLMHFPNRFAIEWICDCLAPELGKLDSEVQINIVGAMRDQLRGAVSCRNVNFLGHASREELNHQMTTADLFIAPIVYESGAKMKLAECVSYRLPFVATDAAMSGLPFLEFIPRIDLRRPAAAARLVVDCINSPEQLASLSRSMAARAERARVEEREAWDGFLGAVVAMVRASGVDGGSS